MTFSTQFFREIVCEYDDFPLYSADYTFILVMKILVMSAKATVKQTMLIAVYLVSIQIALLNVVEL